MEITFDSFNPTAGRLAACLLGFSCSWLLNLSPIDARSYFLHFNLFNKRFPPLNLLRNELHFWTLGVGAMTHGAKLTLLGAMIHGAELLFIASNVVVM